MAEFRYFRLITDGNVTHYRVDPDKPVGARVRVSQGGLWVPSGYETVEQLEDLAPFVGDLGEVPVEEVPCHLCMVVAGTVTRQVVHTWADALVIVPRPAPVVDGHLLVIPTRHVRDALEDAELTAQVVFRAVSYAAGQMGGSLNIATSIGKPATATEPHAHVHLVPREFGDGLPFLWDRGGVSRG